MKIFKFSILLASCLMYHIAYGQYDTLINILPYKKSSREDSLKRTAERIEALQDARFFYERTYLRKQLVFIPIDKKYLTNSQVIIAANIRNSALSDNEKKELSDIFKKNKKFLDEAVKKENKKIAKDNKEIERMIRQQPQIQQGLAKLKETSDYELIFIEKSKVHKTFNDPRENQVDEEFKRYLSESILGIPLSINGYVNSINYSVVDFNDITIPPVVNELVNENVRLGKELIQNPEFRKLVADVSVITKKFPGNDKLWVQTDVDKKIIYLSPYLIRALFIISYYQIIHLQFPENHVRYGNAQNIMRGKGRSGGPVYVIDSSYVGSFLNAFSKNIQFILGHELAHIYLKGKFKGSEEYACDCYSAKNIIDKIGKLNLGLFETMLFNSIQTGETYFWGNFDVQELNRRYILMKNVQDSGTYKENCNRFLK